MTDKELLEFAAKAAGIPLKEKRLVWGHRDDPRSATGFFQLTEDRRNYVNERAFWNPLTNDGDALRLAVKLRICSGPNLNGDRVVAFGDGPNNQTEPYGDDPYAATRRAIVRAAAEIGKLK